MPYVTLLAGPNGAGKSTVAQQRLLKGTLKVQEFVNADTIAAGLSAFSPESAAIQAGRIMLRQLSELSRKRKNFAFESTLSARSFAPWLRRLKGNGYKVRIIFLFLPDPRLAIERVRQRVRLGGHDVPLAVIRRRYYAGVSNFFDLYMPLADQWRIYDNSALAPTLVAIGSKDSAYTRIVAAPEIWRQFVELGKIHD
jgi:predicted ABC-type ATPase